MAHILIVGGTGMLKDAALYFTKHAYTVSVIARNQKGFDNLIESNSGNGFINPLKVDYHDSKLLKEKIESAISELGKIDSCIAWIHSNAGSALYIIADELNNQNINVNFYHVLGSRSPDFLKKESGFENKFKWYENLVYKKIILGFVREKENTRWLTDTEISNAVIDAFGKESDTYLAGEQFKK